MRIGLREVDEACAPYQPFGAALDLMYFKGPEVILSGPAGTGKSRACLEKIHLVCEKYPGARVLILRKTRQSITQTAQVTFETKVVPAGQLGTRIRWRTTEQEYRYPNGSKIAIGGLDNATKIMSAEYDVIYVQEAIEVEEAEWEQATTRLRNGVVPYQQMIADTNPQSPHHWIMRRVRDGKLEMMESRHEDNPRLFDQVTKEPTPEGRVYLSKLDALTGVRKARLRYGKWVSAEGMVYEDWDQSVHLIERASIPFSWPRYWAIDFGFTHPFVWQAWAQDPDGRLYLYREMYRTQRLVEDHCRLIKKLTGREPPPRAIICDHDAEDRATVTKVLEMGTVPAYKAVGAGIQAVQSRLRPAGDGRPRLFVMKGSLVEVDPALAEERQPIGIEDEFASYVWDVGSGKRVKEEPLKRYDHSMDAMRYVVAYVDKVGTLRRKFRPAGAGAVKPVAPARLGGAIGRG